MRHLWSVQIHIQFAVQLASADTATASCHYLYLRTSNVSHFDLGHDAASRLCHAAIAGAQLARLENKIFLASFFVCLMFEQVTQKLS